jgi:hypothetical protein
VLDVYRVVLVERKQRKVDFLSLNVQTAKNAAPAHSNTKYREKAGLAHSYAKYGRNR